jgi:hypothetical protein
MIDCQSKLRDYFIRTNLAQPVDTISMQLFRSLMIYIVLCVVAHQNVNVQENRAEPRLSLIMVTSREI